MFLTLIFLLPFILLTLILICGTVALLVFFARENWHKLKKLPSIYSGGISLKTQRWRYLSFVWGVVFLSATLTVLSFQHGRFLRAPILLWILTGITLFKFARTWMAHGYSLMLFILSNIAAAGLAYVVSVYITVLLGIAFFMLHILVQIFGFDKTYYLTPE